MMPHSSKNRGIHSTSDDKVNSAASAPRAPSPDSYLSTASFAEQVSFKYIVECRTRRYRPPSLVEAATYRALRPHERAKLWAAIDAHPDQRVRLDDEDKDEPPRDNPELAAWLECLAHRRATTTGEEMPTAGAGKSQSNTANCAGNDDGSRPETADATSMGEPMERQMSGDNTDGADQETIEGTTEAERSNGAAADHCTDAGDHDATDGVDAKLPRGFEVREDSVWYQDPDENKPPIRVCGRVEIVAETRSIDGDNWGILLRWRDHDGRVHEWAMPRSMLAGDGTDYRRELLDGGLYVAPNRKVRELMTTLLASVRRKARARAVPRIGWHGDVFVLPDVSFGECGGERILLQTESRSGDSFQAAGDLAGWQKEVARFAVGNSRLAFVLSAAFAAPLLHLLNAESGGVHLRGGSSIGKSTAIEVAASAWGRVGLNGYVKQWRATANGLEGVAAAHSDALLCLDELSQIDARDAGAAAYMLANEQGKARATKTGAARRPAGWRVLFLSTGEIGLADKVTEDGRARRAMAGQQVRILEIPADAGKGLGLFEHLHDFQSAAALAQHLKGAVRCHYGTPARAFIERLTNRPRQIAEAVAKARDEFVRNTCPAGTDGQVIRAAQRFALIAAAGELATAWNILPWHEGEAMKAATECFRAWLGARGTSGPSEIQVGIAQVRRFFELHGDSRFALWGGGDKAGDRPVLNRAGFRRTTSNGEAEYFVLPEVWRNEICAGHDPVLIARALADRGMLLPDSEGKLQSQHRLPGLGKRRCYRIVAAVFGDGSGRE